MEKETELRLSPEARYRTWLTPEELSERIGVAVPTLASWRIDGRGPRFRKLTSKVIAYPISEVLAWEDAHPLLQAASEWEPGS